MSHLVIGGPRRGESGVSALALVITAPIVLLLLGLIVGAGRLGQANLAVTNAAGSAARAASLERQVDLSASRAREVADQRLGDQDLVCSPMRVNVDISSYEPGGAVAATVTCRTQLSDLLVPGFPGSKSFRHTAYVPVEQYREADR